MYIEINDVSDETVPDDIIAEMTTTRDEAATIYFALGAYRDRLLHDLGTHYHNSPRWSDDEDGPFLVETIAKINKMLDEGFTDDVRATLDVSKMIPAPRTTCCYNKW